MKTTIVVVSYIVLLVSIIAFGLSMYFIHAHNLHIIMLLITGIIGVVPGIVFLWNTLSK